MTPRPNGFLSSLHDKVNRFLRSLRPQASVGSDVPGARDSPNTSPVRSAQPLPESPATTSSFTQRWEAAGSRTIEFGGETLRVIPLVEVDEPDTQYRIYNVEDEWARIHLKVLNNKQKYIEFLHRYLEVLRSTQIKRFYVNLDFESEYSAVVLVGLSVRVFLEHRALLKGVWFSLSPNNQLMRVVTQAFRSLSFLPTLYGDGSEEQALQRVRRSEPGSLEKALPSEKALLFPTDELLEELLDFFSDPEQFEQNLSRSKLFQQSPELIVLLRVLHTEREEKERELRRALETSRMALKVLGLGQIEYFPETDTFTYDEAYAQLKQLPVDGSASRSAAVDTIHPDDRVDFEHMLQRLSSGSPGEVVQHVHRHRTPEGTWKWIESNAMLRQGADGRLSRLGLIRDVTEEKEREEELKHLQRLSALGEATASLAHELKSPLAAISMRLEGLLMQEEHKGAFPAPEKLRAQLEECVKVVDGIQARLLQAQSFSRRSSEDAWGEVSLQEVYEMTALLSSGTLRKQEVSLKLEAPADLPKVWGNAVLLEQALLNLINNGRDALQNAAQKELTVRMMAEGEGVRVDVVDTGVGMDESVRARVFEKFFTTKKRGQGTGLGLGVVQQVVEAHHGRIEVASEPGRGTTISLWLPLTP